MKRLAFVFVLLASVSVLQGHGASSAPQFT